MSSNGNVICAVNFGAFVSVICGVIFGAFVSVSSNRNAFSGLQELAGEVGVADTIEVVSSDGHTVKPQTLNPKP